MRWNRACSHRTTATVTKHSGGAALSDWFLVTDDFDAYSAMQRNVDALWDDQPRMVA